MFPAPANPPVWSLPRGNAVFSLSLQYSLFVFLAAIGTVQLAAAYAGLRGLLLARSRLWATFIGTAVLGAAFLWFFGLIDRNVRGLEGAEQSLLFVTAAIAAVTITGVAASLIQRLHESSGTTPGSVPRNRRPGVPRGLEALRSMSYLAALFEEEEGPS